MKCNEISKYIKVSVHWPILRQHWFWKSFFLRQIKFLLNGMAVSISLYRPHNIWAFLVLLYILCIDWKKKSRIIFSFLTLREILLYRLSLSLPFGDRAPDASSQQFWHWRGCMNITACEKHHLWKSGSF